MTAFTEIIVLQLYRILLLANTWASVVIGINRYTVACRSLHAARICTTGKEVFHSKEAGHMRCIILVAYALPRFLEYN